MTKLEYVLSGKGNRQQRCKYAAFCVACADDGGSELMAKYYDMAYNEVVWPHVAIRIIQKEYGRRMEKLSAQFIHDLIAKMIDIDSDSTDMELEIWEEVNKYMEN